MDPTEPTEDSARAPLSAWHASALHHSPRRAATLTGSRTPSAALVLFVQPSPQGFANHGINVRKGSVSNMADENVVQPLLVSTSAIGLASECVRMILKARQ